MLGSGASILATASVEKKILARVILPADKKKMDKLSLNQVVTNFLHIFSLVSFHFHLRLLTLILLLIQGIHIVVEGRAWVVPRCPK